MKEIAGSRQQSLGVPGSRPSEQGLPGSAISARGAGLHCRHIRLFGGKVCVVGRPPKHPTMLYSTTQPRNFLERKSSI